MPVTHYWQSSLRCRKGGREKRNRCCQRRQYTAKHLCSQLIVHSDQAFVLRARQKLKERKSQCKWTALSLQHNSSKLEKKRKRKALPQSQTNSDAFTHGTHTRLSRGVL